MICKCHPVGHGPDEFEVFSFTDPHGRHRKWNVTLANAIVARFPHGRETAFVSVESTLENSEPDALTLAHVECVDVAKPAILVRWVYSDHPVVIDGRHRAARLRELRQEWMPAIWLTPLEEEACVLDSAADALRHFVLLERLQRDDG